MEDETSGSGKSFFIEEKKKESVIYVGGYVIFDAKFQICSKNKIVIQK